MSVIVDLMFSVTLKEAHAQIKKHIVSEFLRSEEKYVSYLGLFIEVCTRNNQRPSGDLD